VRVRFPRPAGGSVFLAELLDALATALRAGGVAVAADDLPDAAGDDVVDVVVPHEYLVQPPPFAWPSAGRRRRTVALLTEHPGTPWFDTACLGAGELGGVLALNRSAVAAARARGLAADHLQLGYVPAWDRWGGGESERDVDLTYLGASEWRRNGLLAGYKDWLWPFRTAILVPPSGVKDRPEADYLVGDDKWRHLARTRVLLNLHRDLVNDTEWPRLMEAICNGAVVLTERCSDLGPLEPGTHVHSAPAEKLGEIAATLLADPEALDQVRRAAYDFVRTQLPISKAAETLANKAADVLSRARRPSLRTVLPPVSLDTVRRPIDKLERPAPAAASGSERAILKRLSIELLEVRRRQDRLEMLVRGESDPDAVATVRETPAFAGAQPRVSIVMPVFNKEAYLPEALESVAASDFRDFELLVIDDRSTDGSGMVAANFLDAHPEVPARLCAAALNHGPSWARNRAVEMARGELLFMLDADNTIVPAALDRLVCALLADAGAAMAYPILAIHTERGPVALHSHSAWRPGLFLEGENPIDTMAMVRASCLAQVGGFCEDPRVAGFEDYDLWCRFADRGLRGISVPQVLGMYRMAGDSVMAQAGIDRTVALAVIRARAPRLFAAPQS
jgi:hypothetical protein